MNEAISYLQRDPTLAPLIEQFPTLEVAPPVKNNVFQELVESILSQQLSVKVAAVITHRLYQLLPHGLVEPQPLLDLDPEAIRACGVSYAKIRYIRSAADAALSGLVNFEALASQTDDEVVAELVQIVGVGQWTAEMLLIFSLGRPDVFSVGDLGIRTAISRLYTIDREDRAAMVKLAEKWSPYRSLACRYLWASLENKPQTQKAEPAKL